MYRTRKPTKKQEEDAAAVWALKKRKVKLPAEEPSHPRVWDDEGRRVERFVTLTPWWAEAQQERTRLGAAFMPIQGRDSAIDPKAATMSARVQHVLSYLPVKQRELLWAYYIEGQTLKELRDKKESKQAVFTRLSWARVAFLRAWLEHAADPIVLHEEDF